MNRKDFPKLPGTPPTPGPSRSLAATVRALGGVPRSDEPGIDRELQKLREIAANPPRTLIL